MREPPSPCTGICRIEPETGWCLGCRRTLNEIADWTMLSARAKATILDDLQRRGPRHWPD
jgi:predicted Fe-S protein YdhL (DUF1289 family)